MCKAFCPKWTPVKATSARRALAATLVKISGWVVFQRGRHGGSVPAWTVAGCGPCWIRFNLTSCWMLGNYGWTGTGCCPTWTRVFVPAKVDAECSGQDHLWIWSRLDQFCTRSMLDTATVVPCWTRGVAASMLDREHAYLDCCQKRSMQDHFQIQTMPDGQQPAMESK